MGEMTIRRYLTSTVGKKFLMAVSAIIWSGFVFGHMAGNMLIFVSADAYNQYGHALTSGKLIYVVEAVLILALLTHVSLAVSLTRQNRSARPDRYVTPTKGPKAATLASRTMAIQGSIILLFIILHIATFKFGTYYETTVGGVQMRDLHRLVVEVFQQPGYLAWYFLALIVLGFHLRHGFGSIFQSLGIMTESTRSFFEKLSWTYAIVVAGGFLSQPIYVFLFH